MPKLTALEKEYIKGYKKFPEKDDAEIQALYLAGLSSFSSESWEEWGLTPPSWPSANVQLEHRLHFRPGTSFTLF